MEFLVDSGASATVINDSMVKVVEAKAPDPHKDYKLADGSTIPNQGNNTFRGVTNEGWSRILTASATEVDRPLLSVHQSA